MNGRFRSHVDFNNKYETHTHEQNKRYRKEDRTSLQRDNYENDSACTTAVDDLPSESSRLNMDNDFRKRLRKTLYCGDLEPEDASLALTDLSVEYFQGLAPHKLGYVDLQSASTITSHDTVSTSSVAMGMIYAKRLQRKRPDYVQKMSSSDLFLISMMMASKYLYDEGVEEEVFNDEWAENADVEKEEMNRMERDFLDALDWELFIKKNEFDHTMLSIERSIALREGLKRGWFSYTDLCILWDDPRLEFWVTDIGLEWLKVALVSSAAYFAAAMTMVGSTVLVTNASLMLASPGVLPVLLPGLQPMGLPQSSPLSQLYGLPSLPALEFPADAFPGGSAGYQQNETADAAKAEELGPEPTNPDVSSVPGKTVVETIMSQLMAVLTLKSHLVQFVSAVADNYTSARSRSTTSKWHDTGLDCTSETGTVFTSDPDMASTADACSRWLEMKKSYGSSAAAGPQETCHCCGEMLAGRDRDGFRSLQFMFPGACSRPLATGHCVDVGTSIGQNPANRINGERGPGHQGQREGQGQLRSGPSRSGGCREKVPGVRGVHHSFPDITIGFTTSMLPPVYAT
ncbi:hypothetical protein BaRGS_00017939 [Batillaria attramentaria]|uniref:Protein CNPPD1 n=1 Tax=Batillaria attramentaria TaxID=370345 RepID=A0ABD0KUC6_9CAEN